MIRMSVVAMFAAIATPFGRQALAETASAPTAQESERGWTASSPRSSLWPDGSLCSRWSAPARSRRV
ncbi:hypothetical protein [Streptosporangium carneum]|uniref:Uncharacterized protein n=1 Tax=Streptosporangium carneum TaxID=47481 RepID=A0A9W6HYG5_9ACTN|nr:hypothetical protein [Streptosporangium carneum]GLK08641.1 hypothetical protein GCM10017600_20460 [Streptosporangium carneum]